MADDAVNEDPQVDEDAETADLAPDAEELAEDIPEPDSRRTPDEPES